MEDITAANDVKPCVTNPLIASISDLQSEHEAALYEGKEPQNGADRYVTDLRNAVLPDLSQSFETFMPEGTSEEQSDVKPCVVNSLSIPNSTSLQEYHTRGNQSQIDMLRFTGLQCTPNLHIPQRPEALPFATTDEQIDVKPCVTDLAFVANLESLKESHVPSYYQINHEQNDVKPCIADIDFVSNCGRPSGNHEMHTPFPVYFTKNEASESLSCLSSSNQRRPVCMEEKYNDSAQRTNSDAMSTSRPASNALYHSGLAKIMTGDDQLEIDIASEQLYSDHMGDETFKCDLCAERFGQGSQLREHLEIHKVKNRFKCNVCDKSFTRKGHLTEHKSVHTGVKAFKCLECGKTFRQNKYLTVHMRIHSGEKPYKCDSCGKCFRQRRDMNSHRKAHTDVKKFRRDEKEESLGRNGELTEHTTVHSGEKSSKCGECGKHFSQGSPLCQHMKAHTEEKLYRCMEVCSERGSQKGVLDVHLKTHWSDEPGKYNESAESVFMNNDLTMHIRQEGVGCDGRGKSFSQTKDLTAHRKTHTDKKTERSMGRKKPVEPKVVYRRLTLKFDFQRRVRTQCVKNVFKCYSCGKNYFQKDKLDLHLRTHLKKRHKNVMSS